MQYDTSDQVKNQVNQNRGISNKVLCPHLALAVTVRT